MPERTLPLLTPPPAAQARRSTQRQALVMAAQLIRDLPGSVLDIGRGGAYDDLCALFPGRVVFGFGRHLAPPAGTEGPASNRSLRDTYLTLHPDQPRAVLAHVDCGPLDLDDAVRPGGLAAQIDGLMGPDGIIVSDWPMRARRWHQFPFELPSFPYFVYRVSHE